MQAFESVSASFTVDARVSPDNPLLQVDEDQCKYE